VTRVSYRLLADLTVALHGAFILFVVGGGFLAWRWRWVAWLHVPCACWGALVELGGWVCPLTPLENAFRVRAGEAGYGGGFIEHYVVPALYPAGLTRAQQVLLGGAVVAVNVLAYGLLIRRGAPSR
jgi:uncharacterized protein DUF2784